MLVVFICQFSIAAFAGVIALRLHLLDLAAVFHCFTLDVVCALRHGVWLAHLLIPVVTAGDHSTTFEPVPRSADLTAIAAHAGAVDEAAAACCVCDGEKG